MGWSTCCRQNFRFRVQQEAKETGRAWQKSLGTVVRNMDFCLSGRTKIKIGIVEEKQNETMMYVVCVLKPALTKKVIL